MSPAEFLSGTLESHPYRIGLLFFAFYPVVSSLVWITTSVLYYWRWERHLKPEFYDIDPYRVAAVTGNPRVANRHTLLSRLQLLEFASIVGLLRRAQRVWVPYWLLMAVVTVIATPMGLGGRLVRGSVTRWRTAREAA